jgi:hypothetical protein
MIRFTDKDDLRGAEFFRADLRGDRPETTMRLHHCLLGLLAEHPGSSWDLLRRPEPALAFVWKAIQSQPAFYRRSEVELALRDADRQMGL